MAAEKTPLVQKLILAVLMLILICLVVLIAQNRTRQRTPLAAVDSTIEPTLPPEPEQRQTKPTESAPVPRGPTQAPRQVVPPATTSPALAEMLPSTSVAQLQATPLPEPYTTLVNPVGRTPVEIVVRPEGGLLKTELCGRVRLEGQPPPEQPIALNGQCRRMHEAPLITRHYVVSRDGGLANVLVYIKEGLPGGYSAAMPTNSVIRAEKCLFEPYVSGVQTGQKLTLFNADALLHNFHATAKSNRDFNIALGLRGSSAQRSFDNPETFIRFKCDVHPWEFAYLGVVPHPFFSVTDTNGVFCLPAGLPHGRYVLAAAHPKAGETLRQILVQEDNLNPIELAFTVER